MKRSNRLFEFEDFTWFPSWIRQMMTLYIPAVHRMLGTSKDLAPLVEKALQKSSRKEVIDMCSGGGGPMPEVAGWLRQQSGLRDLRVTLTDLFPNKTAAGFINAKGDPLLRYELQSVDAGNIARDRAGVRTMICSMHHMAPEVASRILGDAAAKKQPLVVYEISDNSAPLFLWWLAIPFGIVTTLVLTPFIRPLTFRQLFFTYVIPILPLFIAWDGAASNARTYTEGDLRELTGKIPSSGYAWEIGTLRKKGYPGGMVYLIGSPAVAA